MTIPGVRIQTTIPVIPWMQWHCTSDLMNAYSAAQEGVSPTGLSSQSNWHWRIGTEHAETSGFTQKCLATGSMDGPRWLSWMRDSRNCTTCSRSKGVHPALNPNFSPDWSLNNSMGMLIATKQGVPRPREKPMSGHLRGGWEHEKSTTWQAFICGQWWQLDWRTQLQRLTFELTKIAGFSSG